MEEYTATKFCKKIEQYTKEPVTFVIDYKNKDFDDDFCRLYFVTKKDLKENTENHSTLLIIDIAEESVRPTVNKSLGLKDLEKYVDEANFELYLTDDDIKTHADASEYLIEEK